MSEKETKDAPRQTLEEFTAEIREKLTPEELAALGDSAADTTAEAIMCLSVFAPPPATFDMPAFSAVAQLDGVVLTTTLGVLVRLALISETPEKKGRYIVTNEDIVKRSAQFMT